MEAGSVNESKGEESDEVHKNEEKRSDNEHENSKRKMAIQEIKMVERFLSSAVTLHAQAPQSLLNTKEAIYCGKVTVEHALRLPQTLTHQNDRLEGSVPGVEGQDGNSSSEENDDDEYYIPGDKSLASLEFPTTRECTATSQTWRMMSVKRMALPGMRRTTVTLRVRPA